MTVDHSQWTTRETLALLNYAQQAPYDPGFHKCQELLLPFAEQNRPQSFFSSNNCKRRMNDLKHRNESIAQLAEFHKEKRIQEHKSSIKDKQAKLDRLKTLLKLLDQDKLGEDGLNQLKEQLYCAKQLPIKPKIEQNNVSIVYSGQSAALTQPASQLVKLQYGQNIVVAQNMRVSPQKRKQRISQQQNQVIQLVNGAQNIHGLQLIPINTTNVEQAKIETVPNSSNQMFVTMPSSSSTAGDTAAQVQVQAEGTGISKDRAGSCNLL
ncbi:unnamed protein product [Oikopleura dioica]|uniref:Uncharacterized protein n=1 Tax=Oikopleura dioica TaxID=34765 RepID=E4YRI4_OIKDI|nr:unnamed protein product [Oikopleura dioica]